MTRFNFLSGHASRREECNLHVGVYTLDVRHDTRMLLIRMPIVIGQDLDLDGRQISQSPARALGRNGLPPLPPTVLVQLREVGLVGQTQTTVAVEAHVDTMVDLLELGAPNKPVLRHQDRSAGAAHASATVGGNGKACCLTHYLLMRGHGDIMVMLEMM